MPAKAGIQRKTRVGVEHGAKSAVLTAHTRADRLSVWVLQLRERLGWQKAAVALANKNTRILWAVLTRGAQFDANHVASNHVASTP